MIPSKTLVRAFTLAGAAAAMAVAPASAQTLPPAKQIVDRYVEAIGGREAIASTSSRHTVARLDLPSAGMTMDMETWQSRPNKTLMVMNIPGLIEIRQGYDGEVAWAMNPMQGPRIITGDELKQTLVQSDFDNNLRFDHLFPTMETVAMDEAQGRPCYRVRMVTEEGNEAFGCFDTETALLLSMSMRMESEMGTVESQAEFHDYREFGGVRMPSRTAVNTMGQQMEVTVISVDTDPIPASVFVLPAEIQALKQ